MNPTRHPRRHPLWIAIVNALYPEFEYMPRWDRDAEIRMTLWLDAGYVAP